MDVIDVAFPRPLLPAKHDRACPDPPADQAPVLSAIGLLWLIVGEESDLLKDLAEGNDRPQT